MHQGTAFVGVEKASPQCIDPQLFQRNKDAVNPCACSKIEIRVIIVSSFVICFCVKLIEEKWREGPFPSRSATMSAGTRLPSRYKCPVCFMLLIEPVVLPCQHTVCNECFQSIEAQSNETCPMCRQRLSSWSRKRKSQVVDQVRFLFLLWITYLM